MFDGACHAISNSQQSNRYHFDERKNQMGSISITPKISNRCDFIYQKMKSLRFRQPENQIDAISNPILDTKPTLVPGMSGFFYSV